MSQKLERHSDSQKDDKSITYKEIEEMLSQTDISEGETLKDVNNKILKKILKHFKMDYKDWKKKCESQSVEDSSRKESPKAVVASPEKKKDKIEKKSDKDTPKVIKDTPKVPKEEKKIYYKDKKYTVTEYSDKSISISGIEFKDKDIQEKLKTELLEKLNKKATYNRSLKVWLVSILKKKEETIDLIKEILS